MSAIALNSWETPVLNTIAGLKEGGEKIVGSTKAEVIAVQEIRLSPPPIEKSQEAAPKKQEVEQQGNIEFVESDKALDTGVKKEKEKKEIGGLEPYQIILVFIVTFSLVITLIKIFGG